ncbi:hypothetical protein [Streptomyces sp. YIM 130001]|uniref:hypothetical protein n=1 Tax=Streptomyces sp. YIM 130001 TaxID=2259644 RepID=UPI001F098EA2|nr:hypothetical protein [Streptomyces sp. YIM 130001]
MLSLAALLLIPVTVFAGSDGFREMLDFTTGVLCLVSLTASVAWGLVASDRLFLRSRQRLLAQAVHRVTAVASLGFLLLHGAVKVALEHVSAVGALLPFSLGVTGTNGLIGLGSLAGLLMVTAGITGAMRSSFAAPAGIATRWRSLHMLAYPAWCAGLLHGLYAGRAPQPWTVVLYAVSLAGVAGAIALRAAPLPVKRKVADRVLAVIDPEARAARMPGEERAHRAAPLPGMDTEVRPTTPDGFAERAAPEDFTARRASRGFTDAQLPPPRPRMAPPAPQLYEAPYALPDPAPEPYAPGGMAAAYRAMSSTAERVPRSDTAWADLDTPGAPYGFEPGPQTAHRPPPPHRPLAPDATVTEILPPLQAPEPAPAPDPATRWPSPSPPPPTEVFPAHHGPAPHAGTPPEPAGDPARDAYDTGPITAPPTAPFQPPAAGEPWNAPTGGLR